MQQFKKQGISRILFVNIISPHLASLATLIQETMKLWIKKEERPLVGHATILRVKKVHDQEQLTQLLQSTHVEPQTFTINSFVLMESELTPDGPQYTELIRYQLL